MQVRFLCRVKTLGFVLQSCTCIQMFDNAIEMMLLMITHPECYDVYNALLCLLYNDMSIIFFHWPFHVICYQLASSNAYFLMENHYSSRQIVTHPKKTVTF